MKVEKITLSDLPDVYSTAEMKINGESCLLAAPESQGGAWLFSSSEPENGHEIVENLGGCMSLVPLPGEEGEFVAIEGFYPVFQAEGAGIVSVSGSGGNCYQGWEKKRVLDLPFAHRIEVIDSSGQLYFVISALAEAKKSPEDWSKPGATYAGKVPEVPSGNWEMTEVLSDIYKNHGMHVTELENEKVILISGQEGIFALAPPVEEGSGWETKKLVEREVSDVFVHDVDGDGKQEMLTIEPFHGDVLGFYENENGNWTRSTTYPIEFGHVVWAGELLGRPRIIAGSREGDSDLEVLKWDSAENDLVQDFVIDKGVGPTQITVLNQNGRSLVFSANNGTGSVDLYRLYE